MSAWVSSPARADDTKILEQHPRGTLAIVAIFGLIFGLAWLATYVFVFLARGATHH